MRECKIDKARFDRLANPLIVDIEGKRMSGKKFDFSTGSFGWKVTGKVEVMVGGEPVEVQINMNATVIGSKALQGA
ncbi:hypothetical protein C4565_00680 [Candidatus Parcubacteria bacterium]|nr:MAG: hypothetical protein C4565_00680 [Candidatus Parcubacteria bacterium]